MEAVPVGSDPLVGRRRELVVLRSRLAEARSGSGRLVLITGPAGIGKTRLVEELVAETPGPVGWGTASADAGMPALWPWSRATRALPGPRAAVAALAGGGPGDGSTADAAAATTFAADTAVLDALAGSAAAEPGLLLVLDDLQWADEATLRLLDRLAAEIHRLPLLVIGVHRDLSDAATPLHRADDVITVGPFTEAEAAALLAAAVPDSAAAAVREATRMAGGSPLFLRTLARVAADQLSGRRPWTGGIGERPELQHLVAAALRAAGPDATALVVALSVLGTEAEPRLVGDLAGNGAGVPDRIRPAVPAGLVQPPADGTRVRFAHGLVRDAVYASIAPRRRAELHRAAALLLEPTAIAREERSGAVARHWDRAGEPGPAATWAVRAAAAAQAAGAYAEAARFLRLALSGWREAGLDRAELLLDLAQVRYLAGALEDATATCLRVVEAAERTSRAELAGGPRSSFTASGIRR